jgi:two-component system response regulator FlrC
MRVLIAGEGTAELDTAAAIAGRRGALVRRVPDLDAALRSLREGQGADLLLVDVRHDVRAIVERLAAERIHLPIVAYGINAEPRQAVAAIRGGRASSCRCRPTPS